MATSRPARNTRGKVVDFAAAVRKGEVAGLNYEAEKSVIASILLDAQTALEGEYDVIPQIFDMLQPGDFDEPKAEHWFAAAQSLWREDKPVNEVLIHERLKQLDLLSTVGQGYGAECVRACPTAFDGLHYAKIVLDCSLTRATQAVCNAAFMGKMTTAEAITRLSAIEDRRHTVESGSHAGDVGEMVADVKREAIRWLWQGRMAKGKITALEGDPGTGKGLTTSYIVACLTHGRPLPGETEAHPPMNVLLISPEDNIADTIRPRLEAVGADLSRVRVLNTIKRLNAATGQMEDSPIRIPADVPVIEEQIRRDNAGFLLIDPILGTLGGKVKMGLDNEVRDALMPLKMMVERTDVSCIMVRHFTKSGEGKALYRGQGSIGFIGIARFGVLITEHPDAPDKRVLVGYKSNLSKVAGALSFAVNVNGSGDPYASFDTEVCNYDADTLMAPRKGQLQRDILRILKDRASDPDVNKRILSWEDIHRAINALREDGEDVPESTVRSALSRAVTAKSILAPGRNQYMHPDAQKVRNTATNATSETNRTNATNAADVVASPPFVADVALVAGSTDVASQRNCFICGAPKRGYDLTCACGHGA